MYSCLHSSNVEMERVGSIVQDSQVIKVGGLFITNPGGTEFNSTMRFSRTYLGHLLYYAHCQSKQHIMYSIDVVQCVTMLDMESSQY